MVSASRLVALFEGDGPASGVVATAVCCSCGKPIAAWRETLLPIESGEFEVTERGDLGLRVTNRVRCDGCG